MSSINEMMDVDRMATIKAVREYADRIDKENIGFFDRMSFSGNSSDTGGTLYYTGYTSRGSIGGGGKIDESEPEEEEDPQLLFDPKELVLNND